MQILTVSDNMFSKKSGVVSPIAQALVKLFQEAVSQKNDRGEVPPVFVSEDETSLAQVRATATAYNKNKRPGEIRASAEKVEHPTAGKGVLVTFSEVVAMDDTNGTDEETPAEVPATEQLELTAV